jgi:iron complex transport system substrate-binding protein
MMRRTALACLALVTLLAAGCGSDTPSATPAASGSATAGDPGVVVALDDFAALNALSLGVRPDLVLDVFNYETSKAIWADQGITPVPYGAELDVEKVVAAKPDLILGVSIPTTVSQKATLEKVAPTTILDYTADWRTQLDQTARALGRTEQAATITARIDKDVTALKSDLGAGRVVSVLSHNETVYSVPEKTGLGSLLRDAGLDRPAPQKVQKEATAPFVDVSLEKLTEHDGQAIFLMTGGVYDPEPITSSPLWNRLSAVRDGKVYEVSAEMWFGTSPFAVDWVLDDLRATLLDGGKAAAPAEAAARFRAFTTAA